MYLYPFPLLVLTTIFQRKKVGLGAEGCLAKDVRMLASKSFLVSGLITSWFSDYCYSTLLISFGWLGYFRADSRLLGLRKITLSRVIRSASHP